MSKQKTPPNPDPTDDLSTGIDRVAIHKAMQAADGVQAEAHRILEVAGCTKTKKWLHDVLHKDPYLKARWIDGRDGVSLHQAPAKLTPAEEERARLELMEKEAEFMKGHNFAKVFGADAEEALTFADFARNAFVGTVDMIHGQTVKAAYDLRKRAEWINANVLMNTEEVHHKDINKDGELVEWDGPKYSEDDKLEWQKEYTKCMSELHKYNHTIVAAAEARLKAEEFYSKKGNGNGGNGKSGRGNKRWNQAEKA